MTDLELLKATLTQMGYAEDTDVTADSLPRANAFGVSDGIGADGNTNDEVQLTIGSGRGYAGFCCVFFFDRATGKAHGHGCWE